MGRSFSFFFAMLSTGDNFREFLFAYLENKSSQNGKEFALMGASSSLYEMTPINMGDNNKMRELPPRKVYPFTLKVVHVKGSGNKT